MSSFLLSYYSVGYITTAIMAVVISVYLSAQRNKSSQTWFLISYFIFQACLSIGYIVWFSFYTPSAAYATYIVYSAWVGFIFLLQFAYHFPRNIHPRESKIALAVSLIVSFFGYAMHVSQTQPMTVEFKLATHNYTLGSGGSVELLSIVFLISSIWTAVIFFRKTIAFSQGQIELGKGGDERNIHAESGFSKSVLGRYASLADTSPSGDNDAKASRDIFIVSMISVLISFFFVLHETGAIEYGLFAHIQIGFTIVFYLLLAVCYINRFHGPASFMFKLVGLSLAAVLIVMSATTMITGHHMDVSDDQDVREEVFYVKKLVTTQDFAGMPERVHYVVSLPLEQTDDGEAEIELEFAGNINFQLSSMIEGVINAFPISSLNGLADSEMPGALSKPVCLSSNNGTNYINYGFILNGRLYLAGYNYYNYRENMSRFSNAMACVILVAAMVIIAGFPVFINIGLVKPLTRLISGYRNATQAGSDLEHSINGPGGNGIFSGSFNNMLSAALASNRALPANPVKPVKSVQSDAPDKKLLDELRKVRDELRVAKSQQDNDYFHASLFVKPFSSNKSKSRAVKVDYIVKQKKQFQFNKWNKQLGGDICSADAVSINDKPYTVFINADAAGDPFQGASCALTLGVVFESLAGRISNSIYPELWLEEYFVELQRVFMKFDGKMKMSLVFGLVDDNLGVLYFINAEHPRTILYRNGKASFIEDKPVARRLGTAGPNNSLRVIVRQLEPGDVVVTGSHGRDNTLTHIGKGSPVINRDKSRFLKRVNESGGKLEKLLETIQEHGDLTTDISLLRIGYLENHTPEKPKPQNREIGDLINKSIKSRQDGKLADAYLAIKEANKIEKNDPAVLKELIQVNVLLKNYKNASNYADVYIELFPLDTNSMYVASFCGKNANDLQKAAVIGERLRLREPELVKNIVNLAHIYMMMNNNARADFMAKSALKLEPQNKTAQNIASSMENRLKKDAET